MIKISRSPTTPTVLARNKNAWDQVVAAEMAAGETFNKTSVASNYNHPTVKAQLLSDNRDKCMYCESKITHIDHGDIEHIKPKTYFPAEAFDWRNLGLSCSKCNNKKGDHYNPSPVVDPYSEDPSQFFFCDGQMIYPNVGNNRAQTSSIKLDLNRLSLLEQRRIKMESVYSLIDRAARCEDLGLRLALVEQAEILAASDTEYSFVCSSFLAGLRARFGL